MSDMTMRPEGATHSGDAADYYKSAGELNWQRWSKLTMCWVDVGTMPTGSLTPLPAEQVVELEKFVAPMAPQIPSVDELTEAKRLLLKLFKANDDCAGADNCDPAVSQWPGSPLRDDVGKFLGVIPIDPVEAQLQRDEFLYGNSYALRNADGTLTRLDPTLIVIRQRKL